MVAQKRLNFISGDKSNVKFLCSMLCNKIHTCCMWGPHAGVRIPGQSIAALCIDCHPNSGINWFWGNGHFPLGTLVGRDRRELSEVTADSENADGAESGRILKNAVNCAVTGWLGKCFEGRKPCSLFRLHLTTVISLKFSRNTKKA